MPTLQPPVPSPPEVSLDLLRAHPPHRDLGAFLHGLTQARAGAPKAANRALNILVETTRDGGLADAYLWIARLLDPLPAPLAADVAAGLRVAWPAPTPLQLRVRDRVDALVEVARLRDEGRIAPSAVGLLQRLLDPVRVRTLRPETRDCEDDLVAAVRAARDVVYAEAPMTWRLVGADLDRHRCLFQAPP